MPDVQQLPARTAGPTNPTSPNNKSTPPSQGAPGATTTGSMGSLEDSFEYSQETGTFNSGPDREVRPPRHEPKISGPMAFLLIGYAALLDAVGVLLVIFALDDVLILDILGLPLNFYFFYKGMRATWSTTTTLLEAIPYVGALPLKTVGVSVVVWRDRHPNVDAILNVASVAPKK